MNADKSAPSSLQDVDSTEFSGTSEIPSSTNVDDTFSPMTDNTEDDVRPSRPPTPNYVTQYKKICNNK